MEEYDDRGSCGSGHAACKNEPREPHGCPYAEEIGNNYEFQCTCCSECTCKCGMDI